MSTSVRCKGLSSTVGCVLTHLGSGGFTWLQPDRGGVRGGGCSFDAHFLPVGNSDWSAGLCRQLPLAGHNAFVLLRLSCKVRQMGNMGSWIGSKHIINILLHFLLLLILG